jgi:hypothetical protein
MKTMLKLLHIVVLVCFLPAYTQVRDSQPKPAVMVVDSTVQAKEISTIKRSVVIDLWLVKFRIGRRVKADSARRVDRIKDSILNIK